MTEDDFLPFAKETIDIQIAGLQLLRDGLAEPFKEAAKILQQVKGRVIITGMGKSGHIARKIAATMASVGTQAYFVHPGEASHGDMGMISEDDAVIAISNSGEASELLDVLVYCNRFKIPVIGITSKLSSPLGKRCDIHLPLPRATEACPLQKAPTTSTTMTLVLGDALALVLLRAKGFTKQDFGKYHPGGKLGSQLLRISEIIGEVAADLPIVSPTAMLRELMLVMSQGLKGCVGICDDQGKLIGAITDGDLRRYFLEASDVTIAAQAIMSKAPITIKASELAADAVALMQTNKISALFVVDSQNKPIGLLHLQQLMQLGVL